MSRDELLAAWLENELDDCGRAELRQALAADEAFAREASAQLQMKRLPGSLQVGAGRFADEVMLKLRADSVREAPDENAVIVRLQQRRWWRRAGLMTAGLAAAAAITLLLVWWTAAAPRVRVLASEGVQSLDVRTLEDGRPVRLAGGILELALGAKARVVIEGPAEFAVESAERIRLTSGRCYVEMEKGRAGLRIITPSGEVLDLGTRFGVEVREETTVHVFEGAVEVGRNERRSRLREGEGVRWAGGGEAASIPAEAERFVHRLPGGRQSRSAWVHWSFDEARGEVTLPQGEGFSEALRPARLHGTRWIAREGSGALEFNGVDDWVETTFAGIAGGADRTVAAWVKLAPDFGEASGQAIVGWGDYRIHDPNRRTGAAWELGIGDSALRVETFGRLKLALGGPLTVGHADLRDARWHHVAAVYLDNRAPDAPGTVLLYVDGELQRRTFGRDRVRLKTEVRSAHAEPVQFGRQVMRATPEREFFKGAIDEVFIIGAALTGEEIRHLMQHNSLP